MSPCRSPTPSACVRGTALKLQHTATLQPYRAENRRNHARNTPLSRRPRDKGRQDEATCLLRRAHPRNVCLRAENGHPTYVRMVPIAALQCSYSAVFRRDPAQSNRSNNCRQFTQRWFKLPSQSDLSSTTPTHNVSEHPFVNHLSRRDVLDRHAHRLENRRHAARHWLGSSQNLAQLGIDLGT